MNTHIISEKFKTKEETSLLQSVLYSKFEISSQYTQKNNSPANRIESLPLLRNFEMKIVEAHTKATAIETVIKETKSAGVGKILI